MSGLWFDTHAHLSDPQFDPDRSEVMDRAFADGVGTIVEIADGPAEWGKARALADAYTPRIWWAAGLHPYYADQASPEVWQELKLLSQHPRFVAIGEVGLDYAKATVPAPVQKKAFEEAIELSFEIDKPLIIHCREAYPELHGVLRRASYKGVVHCFSGTLSDAEKLISKGFYLGVDGPLTYPSAKNLREVMACVPLDRIVIETDSPYLPPQTHRGQRNEPARVAAVGEKLAEIRGLSVEDIAARLSANSRALFKISGGA